MGKPFVDDPATRAAKLQRLEAKAAADAAARSEDAAERAVITAHTSPPTIKPESPSIAELQEEVRRWTVEKGWADDRSIGDLLMLMVCELAETMEEHRDWHEPNEVRVTAGKPEGIPIELADVVIRILSFCGKYDINLQNAVLQKMAYNEMRPHRHGGKRV